MKTDIIIFGMLLSFIPILAISITICGTISNAHIHKCVVQAIEAKVSADDIQKICYNQR